eukprot:6238405-Amphidinium_carterae.1
MLVRRELLARFAPRDPSLLEPVPVANFGLASAWCGQRLRRYCLLGCLTRLRLHGAAPRENGTASESLEICFDPTDFANDRLNWL